MKQFIFIIVLLLCVVSCKKKPSQGSASEPSAYKIKREKAQMVNEFAAEYNAKTDWQKSIGDPKNIFFEVYTIDVEKAIILPDGQAIAFSGNVEDIFVSEDKYFVRFVNKLSSIVRLFTDIRFELECSKEQVEEIQKHRKEKKQSILNDHFVVLAQISDVEKVRFTFDASSSLYDEDAEIEIESRNIFVAKGKCTGIRCLLCD